MDDQVATNEVSGDLDTQARDAVIHRAHLLADQHIAAARVRLQDEVRDKELDEKKRRWASFHQRSKELRKNFEEMGIKVYEDAIQRRGAHQAAMDQMQGAVGLPLDAAARQAMIEQRERELNPPGPIVNVEVPATHSTIVSQLLGDPDAPDDFTVEPSDDPEVAAQRQRELDERARQADVQSRQSAAGTPPVFAGEPAPPYRTQPGPNPFMPVGGAGNASGAEIEAEKSPAKALEQGHGVVDEAARNGLTAEQLRQRDSLAAG